MVEIKDFKLFIQGVSGKIYQFTIYHLPLSIKLSDYSAIYIYFHLSNDSVKLIYGGQTLSLSERLQAHNCNDKYIINDSNYLAISYCVPEILDDQEIDILEGNKFKYNVQHNS